MGTLQSLEKLVKTLEEDEFKNLSKSFSSDHFELVLVPMITWMVLIDLPRLNYPHSRCITQQTVW